MVFHSMDVYIFVQRSPLEDVQVGSISLDLMNNTAVIIGIQIFVWTSVFNLLR